MERLVRDGIYTLQKDGLNEAARLRRAITGVGSTLVASPARQGGMKRKAKTRETTDLRQERTFRHVHTPWLIGYAGHFARRCREDAARQGFPETQLGSARSFSPRSESRHSSTNSLPRLGARTTRSGLAAPPGGTDPGRRGAGARRAEVHRGMHGHKPSRGSRDRAIPGARSARRLTERDRTRSVL